MARPYQMDFLYELQEGLRSLIESSTPLEYVQIVRGLQFLCGMNSGRAKAMLESIQENPPFPEGSRFKVFPGEARETVVTLRRVRADPHFKGVPCYYTDDDAALDMTLERFLSLEPLLPEI